MVVDLNLQVWLDAQSTPTQTLVIPYLQSPRELQLQYRLHLVRHGAAGNSDIAQGGAVRLLANQPTALSRLSFDANAAADCNIDLQLQQEGQTVGVYHFDCPH